MIWLLNLFQLVYIILYYCSIYYCFFIVDIPVSHHFLHSFYNSLDSYRYLESVSLDNITNISTNENIELLSNKIMKLKRFTYTNNRLNDDQFIMLCNSFKDSLKLKYIDVSCILYFLIYFLFVFINR